MVAGSRSRFGCRRLPLLGNLIVSKEFTRRVDKVSNRRLSLQRRILMDSVIVCGHCGTPAVAELDGDFLCAGCLMNIVMCLEEAPNIRPLNKNTAVSSSGNIVDLEYIYQKAP